jgi:hypothetical protein
LKINDYSFYDTVSRMASKPADAYVSYIVDSDPWSGVGG